MTDINTPIEQVFPPMAEGEYSWTPWRDYVSYESIIESFGYDVWKSERFGSYQGDALSIILDGKRLGVVTFGYGSCSGCDWLEGAQTYDRLDEIRQELYAGIRWFDTQADFIAWALPRANGDKELGSDWYWYDDEMKAFMRKTVEELSIPGELANLKLTSGE